ncbi:nucleoside deaminase [Entomobacter blattae]|nr:nucleoside deaminase [Entomobacter blattae]
MDQALEEARAAALRGEIPVGAIVVSAEGECLAAAGNEVEAQKDASAHAEILALRRAAHRLGCARLTGCTLYVTLEPCAMCAAAIGLFRVKKLVFGAYDPKGGGIDHGAQVFQRSSHFFQPEIIGGVKEQACRQVLVEFFHHLRLS